MSSDSKEKHNNEEAVSVCGNDYRQRRRREIHSHLFVCIHPPRQNNFLDSLHNLLIKPFEDELALAFGKDGPMTPQDGRVTITSPEEISSSSSSTHPSTEAALQGKQGQQNDWMMMMMMMMIMSK